MNVGDVGLVNFPFTDGSSAKKRPVLVVALSARGPSEDEIIVVAQITSSANRFADLRQGDLVIQNWQAAGFPKPCVIRCRRIFGTQPSDVLRTFGKIDAPLLARVKGELKSLLKL